MMNIERRNRLQRFNRSPAAPAGRPCNSDGVVLATTAG